MFDVNAAQNRTILHTCNETKNQVYIEKHRIK